MNTASHGMPLLLSVHFIAFTFVKEAIRFEDFISIVLAMMASPLYFKIQEALRRFHGVSFVSSTLFTLEHSCKYLRLWARIP
jgi:hypothetical protein